MNIHKEWKNILAERKAETLKSQMEKDRLDQEGQTFFQKFNNFMVVFLLVAVPIATTTALVLTAKSCSPYKDAVKIEQKQKTERKK